MQIDPCVKASHDSRCRASRAWTSQVWGPAKLRRLKAAEVIFAKIILGISFFMFYEKTVTFQERKNNDHLPLFKMGWNSSVWNFLWYCFWQYNWFCNHTIVEQTYDTALREWIFGNIWELLPKRYKKCTGMNENWCELVIGSSPDSCLQPEPRKQIWHFSPGFGPLGLLSKLS